MVIMESGDLLTEVSMFLGVTLAGERLSEHAEECRQQLMSRLALRETSPPPQAYIDMNGSHCQQKISHQINDCYEEFDSSFDLDKKSKQHIPRSFVNNLYNNLSSKREENVYANNDDEQENYINIEDSSQYEDNAYINPTSPLANTPFMPAKPAVPPKTSRSNSNSERSSIISCKKDSPDRVSVSSSFTSSFTRCDDSPEVLTTSASALRYAATKSGILGRREKFLFVDHTKLYWVALLNQTLFIFTNDKESKPVSELDVTGYKARQVAITTTNKTDFKFELVAPGKKTYQFSAEKQSDMDSWVSALNSATRTVEFGLRQLPSLPRGQDTYDQPDSPARPLLEAEYELPDTVQPSTQFSPSERCVMNRRNNSHSSIGNEQRQLPLLPYQQETYDQPEPGVRPVARASSEMYESLREELYHCIDEMGDCEQPQKSKEMIRQLPLLPESQETYDQPEKIVRPVVKPDCIIQEEFYSVIDADDTQTKQPISQKAAYKNETKVINEGEINYYNLMPSYPEQETDQECIYDVISEQYHLRIPSAVKERLSTDIRNSSPTVNSISGEIKMKLEEKRLSPLVSNMASIFSKPFTKPHLKEVKPPVTSKTCQ